MQVIDKPAGIDSETEPKSVMTDKNFTIAAYCSSTAWGGLEMNILRFLVWMHQRGWMTILYAPAESSLCRKAQEAGIKARFIKSSFKYGDIVNARRLARFVKEDHVGILTLQQSRDIFLGVLAKRLAGSPFKLVYSQHMHIGGDKKDFFHSWEYGHFDAWVTPLPWLADRVKEKTTIPDEKIHIIPHGIELERFTSGRPDKKTARQELDLPQDIAMVGIIGRLDPKKCQDIAVKALAGVHRAGHSLHLVIIGAETHSEDTGYGRVLRQLVCDLDLNDFVHFRPHQEKPEFAYAALDMFVLASKSETYGMVTIEAMASGLPVIGTAEGGTLDIIAHEKNGLLFTPMNEEELTAAMVRYVTDPELAARLADEAEKVAADKYSHTSQCEGWERMIDKICK